MLSIVFVNYNLPELLQEALESLARYRPDFPIEVIVVDNGSQQPFPQAWADGLNLPKIRWIRNLTNRGYGPAANQGIAVARGRYVAISGTDVLFRESVLEKLVTFLDEHPEAGIVSPQLLWADGKPQPTARRFPRLRYLLAGRRSLLSWLLPRSRLVRDFTYAGIEASSTAVCVEAVIGAFLVARRGLLQKLGGFDERFFFYVEDVDLCERAARLDERTYLLPQAQMIHHLGLCRRHKGIFAEFQRLRSFYQYFRKTYPGLPVVFLLTLFAGQLALLSAGEILGLREWEYSMGIRNRSLPGRG